MANKLTDLSGIGEKTADKLRDDGIETPSELGEAYRQNRREVRERGTRVQSAARDALLDEQEEFTDPVSGATVSEDNRAAFEKIATRKVSDFGSISVQGSNPKTSPDDEVREFIEPVTEGEFSTRIDGDDNLLAFAADAADNLGVDSLSSGELQDLNRAAEQANKEITLRKNQRTALGTTTVGDFYQARAVHQDRSPEARRVDNQRKAETTTDFGEWRKDPSRHDFPGVDTPKGADTVLPEEKKTSSSMGLGTTTRTNTARSKAERAFETFSDLNEEQRERIFDVTSIADSPFGGGR